MHPERRNIRLKNYDYRNAGIYFITVCTHNRLCILSTARENKIELTSVGKIIEKCWLEVPDHFPFVTLDEFIIMPNHFHGILCIETDSAAPVPAPDMEKPIGIQRGSLASVIGSWKAACSRFANQSGAMQQTSLWQRNYYERIIRDQRELDTVREYIRNNPLNWKEDSLHP